MLRGHVQIDDAYLGGERSGGKVGRGSKNKIPFVAAVSLNDDGHPLRIKLTPVPGFPSSTPTTWNSLHSRSHSPVKSGTCEAF